MNLKCGLSYRRQIVRSRSRTLQGSQVIRPGTVMIIILSLEFKSEIKDVHGNLSNPFSDEKVRRQKHHVEAVKYRNSIAYINHVILSNYCHHLVQDNQCPETACHHRPFLRHSVKHLYTKYTPHYLGIRIWIIYSSTIRVSSWTKPEVIRRKRICPPYMFRCLFFLIIYQIPNIPHSPCLMLPLRRKFNVNCIIPQEPKPLHDSKKSKSRRG